MKRYELCVRGSPHEAVSCAFEELEVSPAPDGTVLRGTLPDQAALFGVLTRIRGLGLELVRTVVLDDPGETTISGDAAGSATASTER